MSGVLIGVGAFLGAGSSVFGIGGQNRSAIAAFKKQMKYLQMNYNYNQAALDKQERSLYDNALGELFQLSYNAYQNNAQIEAAIAETGLEGRSQEKIEQVVKGQTERQETATKEAYMMDVWNVRSQKDALYIQTKASVEQAKDNLNNNLIHGSKAFQQFLGSALQGAAIGAATAGALGAASSALAPGAAAGATGAAGATAGAAGAAGGTAGAATAGAAGATAGATGAAAGAAGASTNLALFSAGSGLAGQVLTQGASTGAASSQSGTGVGGFLNRMTANYQQYKPYVDFVQQWANYYNQNLTPRQQRGGYFY